MTRHFGFLLVRPTQPPCSRSSGVGASTFRAQVREQISFPQWQSTIEAVTSTCLRASLRGNPAGLVHGGVYADLLRGGGGRDVEEAKMTTLIDRVPKAKPGRTLRNAGSVLSACVAVLLAATLATAQLPVVDLSDRPLETLIPPEFEGGFFNRIGAMVIRDDGLWVLDTGQRRVFRFDTEGRLVVAFGRQGNGPGELLWPSAMRVDSVVTIPDMRQVRVSRFTLDGEHLETRRVSGPVVPSGGLAVLRNGVTVYATAVRYTMGSGGPGSDPYGHVTVGFTGSNRSDTIASLHGSSVMWQAAGTMSLFRTDFGAAGAWTTMGDSAIVVADGITGTISVFTVPGSPGMEADTPQLSVDSVAMRIEGLPVSNGDRERAEADFRRDNPSVRGRVTFEGWPSHWSVATSLLVSDDGKVWAQRVVDGDERQHWTEVDLQGSLRRHFILPERFSLRAIADGKLYGVARDELDVQRLAILDRP
ncbi:MAG: 6-bladed beta-propeller [Gammaproteobacteria bacterium]|nr:6-bladed beta-propeller [Gammaproteobacteria bacterium]